MDQNVQSEVEYEAPKVEDLDAGEGPATVAAGTTAPPSPGLPPG